MREWIVAGYQAKETTRRFIRNFFGAMRRLPAGRTFGFWIAINCGVCAHGSEPKIILYPDADLPQARKAFERFRESVRKERLEELFNVQLKYLPIEVTNEAKLRDTLRAAIADKPAVIIGTSGTTALAAKQLTNSIPIIFATQFDPTRTGLVVSHAKPGGNLTGFTFSQPVDDKRLQILKESFPAVKRVAVLGDRYWVQDEFAKRIRSEGGGAGNRLGMQVQIFEVNDLDGLKSLLQQNDAMAADAWYVPLTFLTARNGKEVVAEFTKTRKPVIYDRTNMVERGGLLSYQQDIKNPTQIWAGMLKMILSGVKPGDIPVERPKDFELAVNIGAAKAMGITLPKSILRRADITY